MDMEEVAIPAMDGLAENMGSGRTLPFRASMLDIASISGIEGMLDGECTGGVPRVSGAVSCTDGDASNGEA